MGKQRDRRRIDRDEFVALDKDFRSNDCGDLLVRAFNALNADDRALMLAYMSAGYKVSALVRQLGVSRPVIEDRLWRIQVIVKERYEKLKKETDPQYKPKTMKQNTKTKKRTLLAYEADGVREFSGVEEAARHYGITASTIYRSIEDGRATPCDVSFCWSVI